MHVVTYITESHLSFLPRLSDSVFDNTGQDLVVLEGEQHGSGEYKADDQWSKAMAQKLSLVLDFAEDKDQIIFYIDADSIVYGDVREIPFLLWKHNADVIFQHSRQQRMCFGMFGFRPIPSVKSFFHLILAHLEGENEYDDEDLLNEMYPQMSCRCALLPHRYWSLGTDGLDWVPGVENFNLPENLMVHHAAFVTGVERKQQLLELVHQKADPGGNALPKWKNKLWGT